MTIAQPNYHYSKWKTILKKLRFFVRHKKKKRIIQLTKELIEWDENNFNKLPPFSCMYTGLLIRVTFTLSQWIEIIVKICPYYFFFPIYHIYLFIYRSHLTFICEMRTPRTHLKWKKKFHMYILLAKQINVKANGDITYISTSRPIITYTNSLNGAPLTITSYFDRSSILYQYIQVLFFFLF